MMRRMLDRERLALGERTYAYRPRSLSLGSGIDLFGKYWAQDHEIGDRIHEGGERESGKMVGEQQKIEEPGSPDISEQPQRLPHRHVYSLHETDADTYSNSTPEKPTLTPASSSTSLPQLHHKPSKSKIKASLLSKVALRKSYTSCVRSKTVRRSGEEEERIHSSVESDDRSSQRDETPNTSDGFGTVGLVPPSPECGKRKENGWSGEWNRNDMDEVVKALRELKAQ